jgi:hypothetical protein
VVDSIDQINGASPFKGSFVRDATSMARDRTVCLFSSPCQFRIIELDLQQNGPTVKKAGLDVRQERRVCDIATWRGDLGLRAPETERASQR